MAHRFLENSTCGSRDRLWAAYHKASRELASTTATFSENNKSVQDGQAQLRLLLTGIARHCITCGCDPQWTVHLASTLPSHPLDRPLQSA